MTETVPVTNKEYEKAKNLFSTSKNVTFVPVPPEEERIAEFVRRHPVRAVVLGVEPYRGPIYEALAESARNLGATGALIARFGVGHDGIDKDLASHHGIYVVNTPDVLSRSVAEHVFWLAGSLLRNVVLGDAAMRAGGFPSFTGTELYGKTLLVVGFGSIGRHVARIARFGFDMRVLAVGSRPLREIAADCGQTEHDLRHETGLERLTDDVDAVLAEADVVSLHLTSNATTRHYFSADRFEKMKPSGILINTSRGPIVDESALFRALSSHRIAGAALDVFEEEPYRPLDEKTDLRSLSNIVLTPHLGSSTTESNGRMAEAVVRNIRLFFERRFSEMNVVSSPPSCDYRSSGEK